jgi:ATP-dependent DNA helicase PIF1
MTEDILHRTRQENPTIELDFTDAMYNQALIYLEDRVMSMVGKSLAELRSGLPLPQRDLNNPLSRDMLLATNYNPEALAEEVRQTLPRLSPDQTVAFNRIVEVVEKEEGGLIFLDAPGGTGKTFLINLLLSKVRSERKIAIPVASSGIAATLLTGGRTAHSAFKLPLDLHRSEFPVCNISKGTALAQVLQRCKLIVWDECTMAHKGSFEALDRTLQDLRGNDNCMGGVALVLSGDFRQTLPIIPRGTPADELRACLKNSYLWPGVRKLSLTTNQRVRLQGDAEAGHFSDLLLHIGEARHPVDQNGQMEFPSSCATVVKTIEELRLNVFPDLAEHRNSPQYRTWLAWLSQRAILAPKNDAVDFINSHILSQLPGEERTYKSMDTVLDIDQAVHFPTEFLNSLQSPGMPPHNLVLRKGAPIILLRNMDPPRLCNGTRLCVKQLLPHVIEATIMTGCAKYEDVFIPRIPMIPTDVPYEFKRLQFPVKLCFAMSINKAQGQSLLVAGVDLTSPCFSHGQLYVACSRVGASKNLFVLAPTGKTNNVVYPQALL